MACPYARAYNDAGHEEGRAAYPPRRGDHAWARPARELACSLLPGPRTRG